LRERQTAKQTDRQTDRRTDEHKIKQLVYKMFSFRTTHNMIITCIMNVKYVIKQHHLHNTNIIAIRSAFK